MLPLLSAFVLFFTLASCMSHEDAKLMYENTIRMATAEIKNRGCSVNVCFAMDTSGSVTSNQFQLEKNFLIDVTSIIGADPRSKFAAGQYGTRTYRISRLTNDVETFNWQVRNAKYKNDRGTSVGSGIVYCHRQLRREMCRNPHSNHANKMVVLGDGRNTMGGDPVRRANNFRNRMGGVVSTVGVGFQNTAKLAAISGGLERVFSIDDYIELSFVIDDLVFDICGIVLDTDYAGIV